MTYECVCVCVSVSVFMSLEHAHVSKGITMTHIIQHVYIVFQEAVRVRVNGLVSPRLHSHPLLPLPPECHSDACVRAVSHGVLHTRHCENGGHSK